MGAVHYNFDNFPPKNLDWARLAPLVGRANAEVARYDGLLASMHSPSVLLAPLAMQEAVLSSAIEGTNVTLSEVLEIEAGGNQGADQEKKNDVQEVLNYRYALGYTSKSLEHRQFSLLYAA